MSGPLGRHAEDISAAARAIADAVLDGGRILVHAGSGGPAHVEHHVAHVVVEFVHPVTAGRRAIPAVRGTPAEAEPGDVVIDLGCDAPGRDEPGPDEPGPGERGPGAVAVIWPAGWLDHGAAGVDDADLVTAYHLLWEAVHTWLDHRVPT